MWGGLTKDLNNLGKVCLGVVIQIAVHQRPRGGVMTERGGILLEERGVYEQYVPGQPEPFFQILV